MSSPLITVHDCGFSRPTMVRLMIGQITADETDFVQRRGLYFHREPERIWAQLDPLLSAARRHTANIIVFPELCVPIELVPSLQSWSTQTGAVVIGGSHYHETQNGFISRSPVIVAGKVFFTHKLVPAPIEVSPVVGEGLVPGSEIVTFQNTPAGNVSVLICSDYLDAATKRKVLEQRADILCVPACQSESALYHSRMSIDCEEAHNGLYIAYANARLSKYADGHSAVFALMDRRYLAQLKEYGYSDQKPPYKACELGEGSTHLLADLDMDNKRPQLLRDVHTRPNVRVVQVSGTGNSDTTRFLKAIAHDDDRYSQIADLFVAPAEYGDILSKLEEHKIVFIVGDPGIGKTYTAARLLRQYFDKGYEPLWYTGLDKEDRACQRRVLECLTPVDRQVIYFEDPFGRNVFEDRSTLYRFFSPLADKLRDVDARVIITSRREIFEQFASEHLSSRELRRWTEEMSIVKPSYGPTQLVQILDRLARNRCAWYQDVDSKRLVNEAILGGSLGTPFVIRDFVWSTTATAERKELADRLRRRKDDVVLQFAQDLQATSEATRVALTLILFFGGYPRALLNGWFAKTLHQLQPTTASPSFTDEIRGQLGYRIEHYGRRGERLRFSHPYYEEGFVAAAVRSEATAKLVEIALLAAAQADIRGVVNSIAEARKRHRELSDRCLSRLSGVLAGIADIGLQSQLMMKILAKARGTPDDGFRLVLQSLVEPDMFLHRLHAAANVQSIAAGLKFVVAYLVSEQGIPAPNRASRKGRRWLREQLQWDLLLERCRSCQNPSQQREFLECLERVDPKRVSEFLKGLPRTLVLSRAVAHGDRRGWAGLLRRCGANDAFSEAQIPSTPSWRSLGWWFLENARPDAGVMADWGAIKAMRHQMSCLPAGVVGVVGAFEAGEIVSLFDPFGVRIGAAIASYDADHITLMQRQHSSCIRRIADHWNGPSVVKVGSVAFLGPQKAKRP